MIARLPLPEYRPDLTANSGILLEAENVFPALDGYRGVGALVEISDALPADFFGGGSAISNNGTAYLLAGTATNLYRLTGATGAWTSMIGSLTASSRWQFAQFGDYVIGVNGSTTIEVDLAANSAAALAGAPSAKSIAVIGDFVILGQPNNAQLDVKWSAFRDHTGWTDGVGQAGSNTLQTGGSVEAIAGGEYGVILQRERIVRMTRTGDSTAPFQFDEISANFGCSAGATMAQAGRTVFFLSDRGFMALDDGQSLRAIGTQKVDRAFAEEVPRTEWGNIYTAVDPENNLVFWFVPGAPARLWVYNFQLERWSRLSFNAKGLFSGFSTSTDLDSLPSLGYTDLDAMSISLDDPRWSGGSPRLYVVSNNNKIGTLSGTKQQATITLANAEIGDGRQSRLRAIRPFWDGTSGMTARVTGRARLGDAGTEKTTTTLRQTGRMPVRVKGRHISTQIEIAAGTEWDYIQGIEFEFERGGER